MRTQIRTIGNTLVVRIPKAYADEVGLVDGSLVDLSVLTGTLVISPSTEPPVTLEALLARVTLENVHPELRTGPRAGAEIW